MPVAVATTLLVLSTSHLAFAERVAGSTLLDTTVTEKFAVATGWSVRHDVLGRLVYNEKNQSIGRVDDVIVAPDKKASYAIIDPHRYFRMITHDVAIPVSALREHDGKFILPHVTQDELKAAPPFAYAR
jgi:hypothetical protein